MKVVSIAIFDIQQAAMSQHKNEMGRATGEWKQFFGTNPTKFPFRYKRKRKLTTFVGDDSNKILVRQQQTLIFKGINKLCKIVNFKST